MAKQYLNISQPAPNKARIEIDGTIGGFDWDTFQWKNTGTDIRKQLKKLSELNVTEIEVLITSLGGHVDDALQIHDALKSHPAKVTTIVQGFCASAATVIACAGDERLISPNALYLIHKCRCDVWAANENTLEEELEAQRTVNTAMLNIYKGVLKKSETELEELFGANHGEGKWITADEALEFGFATAIQEFETAGRTTGMVAAFLNRARDLMPHTIVEPVQEPENNTTVTQKANIPNQKQTEMKKIMTSFAMLAAVLSYSAEAEYDEQNGMQMSADSLQKIEDALKSNASRISELEKELEAANTAKADAESKAAEKDTLIETLTSERDDYKNKYLNAPAQVTEPSAVGAAEPEKDITDNEMYEILDQYI